MSEDFDPDALAAVATGEAPADAGDDVGVDVVDVDGESADAGAEATEESARTHDLGSTLRNRLLSTEPDIPLADEQLSAFEEHGGARRIKRGIYKMIGVDGATAAEDIGLGLIEEMIERSGATDGAGDSDHARGDRADEQSDGEAPTIDGVDGA